MISTKRLWAQRDQVLQTLYIPPALQTALPQYLFGSEMPPDLSEYIVAHDLPYLASMFEPFGRTAAPRFFNLPSARRAIEQALRSETEMISQWLKGETSVRLSFDYFGEQEDWIVGYGVAQAATSDVRTTRTLRLVLQRADDNSYVLWTAFPLLSPRSECWLDVYDFHSHRPRTQLPPVFYYFLSSYLSVTSDCVFVNSVLQGVTDFWLYESSPLLQQLHHCVQQLTWSPLSQEDSRHLQYELNSRCLDETLPSNYLTDIPLMMRDLEAALRNVVNAEPPVHH